MWPVLLLVLAMVLRRRVARGAATPSLRVLALAALGTLSLASFAWSLWATYDSPASAYFSSFTRAWELGLGSLLAVALATAPRLALPRRVLGTAALAGVVASRHPRCCSTTPPRYRATPPRFP